MDGTTPLPDPDTQRPRFSEALTYWAKLGLISFGGPAGQIALMQAHCVDAKRWIGQDTFLRAINYCMLLPGPEAQQLAAYIGWRLHGIRGGVAAGTLFVLPGALLMIALAWTVASQGDTAVVQAVFQGVTPVVIGIVCHAVWRIGRKTLTGLTGVMIALGGFSGLALFGLPFPAVIALSALIGLVLPETATRTSATDTQNTTHTAPGYLLKVAIGMGLVGVLPPVALLALLDPPVYADVAALFTTAAFVTFGGAYAVLPYIADAGVNVHGWISAQDMISGLALAETTPGPLILVTTFVGFFAGWADGTGGLIQAVTAALLATWVTYLPSFLFILGGAPYVERLQDIAWARRALSSITAAVVGVIASLAVFLGQATFLAPDGSLKWTAVAGAGLSFGLLVSGRMSVPLLVALGAALGGLSVLL